MEEFKEQGASIFAASVDSLEKAQEVSESLSFPVAWGVDRELGDKLGSFWDQRGDFIQPTELIINHKGRVVSSTYSSSPVGRADPAEVLTLLKYLNARKNRRDEVKSSDTQLT